MHVSRLSESQRLAAILHQVLEFGTRRLLLDKTINCAVVLRPDLTHSLHNNKQTATSDSTTRAALDATQRGYSILVFYYVVKAIADRNIDRARARRSQTATMSSGENLRRHVRKIIEIN